MDSAIDVLWNGDSEIRFLERALEREAWGNYNGNAKLGQRFIEEVQHKILEISKNLNQYQVRENDERVVPLEKSGYILIYRKEIFYSGNGVQQFRCLILDVRKSY